MRFYTVRGFRRRQGLAALLVALTLAGAAALAQTVTGPAELKIGGAVPKPLVVSVADLKKMPRRTLRVTNAHNQQTEAYEGVALADLLARAGVPQGDQIKGPWLAAYVSFAAADGYRVIFSLAELDAGFLDSEVLVADTMDGAPLSPAEGPFKLVAPHDKRPARWVRMLKSISVVQAPGE
jgi:DMSO/TMAO reductase YedYZ molybdopterin-dependent catalytic subunit